MINISKRARPSRAKSAALTIGALGVVFGDIGTSPLYAMNEIFFGESHSPRERLAVFGCLSLVFWTLTLVICLKYLKFVLRADNKGEGGVFALYARIHKYKQGAIAGLKILLMLGAGLLFGEGIITPAISVLSAIEGISLVTPIFETWTVPLTILVLLGLFSLQKKGIHSVGKYFGPIALLWFVVIGFLGLMALKENPEVILAVNPMYIVDFLKTAQIYQILILFGSVLLVITGGEALFADMGHFGLRAIRSGWYFVVYPALLLNYFGQGAYLLGSGQVVNGNIFYSMVPHNFLVPMVVLSTMAAIIASQALISGAFSLGAQAIALGLFPRLKAVNTHEEHVSQVYLPFLNWALFLGSVALVLAFKKSSALASFYGLALSGVMFCTSLAMIAISTEYWKWSKNRAIAIFGSFAILDGIFLVSKSLKFVEGAYIPISIGLWIFFVMRIWRWGRKATYFAYSEFETPTLRELVKIKENAAECIRRNVVLMVPKPLRSLEDNAPALMQFFLNRYGLLPENLFLVEVVHRKVPYIQGPRCEHYVFYKDRDKGCIVSVTIHFGFMEEPNVELALEDLAKAHEINLPSDPHKWLVHVSHERLVPSKSWSWIQRFRLQLFLLFRQSTQPAYYYYGLGTDVNLSVDIMAVRLK
jgi:KUP system potassium uptake protein